MTGSAEPSVGLANPFRFLGYRGFWSTPACVVFLLVLLVEQLHIVEVSTISTDATIVRAALAGTATAAAVVLFVRIAMRLVGGSVHPAATVSALIVIGIARTWPQWSLTPASDLSVGRWYPVLQSTVFTVTFGLLLGLTSARVVQVLASMRKESVARAGLADRERDTARALDRKREQLRTWAQLVVVPAMNSSLSDLARLERPANRTSEVTRRIADLMRGRAEDVRVASHRLDTRTEADPEWPPNNAQADGSSKPEPEDRIPSAVSLRESLAGLGLQVVSNAPFHPFLIPSVALVSALGTVYRLRANVVPLLIAAITIFAVLYLLHRVATPVVRRLPIPLGICCVFTGYALAGLAACGAIVAREGLGDPAVALRLIGLTVAMVTVIGVAVALSAAGVSQLGIVERETAALTASARWELGRSEDQLNALTEAVSEALHSEIQGRLVLVALLLDDLAANPESSGEEVGSATIELARQSLTQARDDVLRIADDGREDGRELWSGLTELASLWMPPLVIELVATYDRDAETRGLTDTLLLRAVRDTVANAARHGAAHRVVITLDSRTRILVDDDGVGTPDTVVPQGLSYRHFTGAGGSWTYSRSELGGIRVTLVAPSI